MDARHVFEKPSVLHDAQLGAFGMTGPMAQYRHNVHHLLQVVDKVEEKVAGSDTKHTFTQSDTLLTIYDGFKHINPDYFFLFSKLLI